MSRVATIIEAAFQEGLKDIDQHPTPSQYQNAFARLTSLVKSVFGNEVGEGLTDWSVGTSGATEIDAGWTADHWRNPYQNSRLVVQHTAADTVQLPENPDDGARIALMDPLALLGGGNTLTLNGNGRRIGASVAAAAATYVASAARSTAEFFYRSDLGIWLTISPLASDGDMPFPEDFDDYFITMLAMRLNPRYGRSLPESTLAALERQRGQIRVRYRQRRIVGVDPGLRASVGGFGMGSGLSYGGIARGRRGWMR